MSQTTVISRLGQAAHLFLAAALVAGTIVPQLASARGAEPAGNAPNAPPQAEVLAPPALPSSPLVPSDLAALPELSERRTANSAVFQAGQDRYVALLSAKPLHYLDQDGAWQPIDLSFRSAGGDYVVERNSLKARAGARQAWFSASAGQAAIYWQATSLGLSDGDGSFSPVAGALPDTPAYAWQTEAGNELLYQGGWTDSAIHEKVTSRPGSLEHSLILNGPPQVEPRTPFLEMRAALRVLPGAELWADGTRVIGDVPSARVLEVRDPRGGEALVFSRVLAFESGNTGAYTEGNYAVSPGAGPDSWQVSVRTNLAWWLAPERVYPAVLDPVITVQRPTGWGEGVAWVRSTGDKAFTYGEMLLGAHLPDYNTESRGYVQFNSLPAVLTNSPISVSAAFLDVEPTSLFIPEYEYHGSGFTDWDSVAVKREAALGYVGACPADAACNDFTLQGNPPPNLSSFNWDTQPTGAAVGTEKLTVGPIKTSGNANPTVTSWNVTAQLQSWYTAWWDKANPRPGPTFKLQILGTCPKPMPYVSGFVNGKPQFDSELVPQCTHFVIPAGKVSLRIEYTELPVGIGASLLNSPGVPSYTPLSGSSDNLFLNPNHQYKLATPTGPARWRAVALRGNHAYAEALPAWATLKLLDYSAVPAGGEPEQLLNPKAPAADATSFFFVDDHLAGSPYGSKDLRVEVVATEDNGYAGDQQRNYRLQYAQSSVLDPLQSGNIPNVRVLNLQTDRLISLNEFHLNKGDTLGITVTAPISVDVAVLTPATAVSGALVSANSNYNPMKPVAAGSELRSGSLTAPVDGIYALTMVNRERPVFDPDRGMATTTVATFHILVCPEGSYPTARYGCQPLILPDNTIPYPPKPVSIPGSGSLSVYSEGGFTPGAGGDWCTTNEGAGAPIIGPAAGGRWVAVVQGSVCYQGGVLTTTPDSAPGIIVPTSVVNPNNQRGQIRPVPIYGDSMLLPAAAQPDGEVTLTAGGRLTPNADTIKRITPFEQYWSGAYGHNDDYIATADMKAYGSDTATAQVTIDAAGPPVPVNWTVNWSLYPFTCAACDSEWAFVDDPAQPSAAFPLEIDLASATVRLLNGGLVDGKVHQVDAYEKTTGPVVFQFHNTTARLTVGPLLGGTTKPVQAVVQPPGWPRNAEGQGGCDSGGSPTSCLDLRRAEYAWQPLLDAEQNVLPWSLPDLHIETAPATALFSRAGKLNIYSSDHPAAVAAIGQTFSFDTWEAGVHVAQEKCIDTDPSETTVIRGTSYIALPTVGDDGSGDKSSWIKAAFRLCETSLQQAHLSFGVPKPGVPVGSIGFGVNLLDGDITINPGTGQTRITLGVGFQTLDGHTLTKGKGTVTLDTLGMLSLQAIGTLVGVVSADELRLDVAWNPLDVLFKGQVSYGSGLVSGNVSMHSWIGQGWQGKYAWLPANDEFHFTGSIEATVRLKSGDVVDDWPFVLPPFTISLSSAVQFGEFCANASCTSQDWGMSATVKVLGYKVGVYVDDGGPDLILGSSSHKLIDQPGASAQSVAALVAADPPPPPIQYPGTSQIYLGPVFSSPFDGAVPEPAATACTGIGTATVDCPFTIAPGMGRALFTASWENGDLAPVIVKPNGTVISPANAQASGVEYAAQPPGLVQVVSYSVVTPTTGATIDAGVWKMRLSNVGIGLLPGFKNNYSLLFAADPPAATLAWLPPQDIPAGKRLLWSATRGVDTLNPDLEVELFAIPVAQKPVTPTQMAGTVIWQKVSANSGQYDWNLAGLAAGEYAYGARVDDHATGNGHIVVWSPHTVTVIDTTPRPCPPCWARQPTSTPSSSSGSAMTSPRTWPATWWSTPCPAGIWLRPSSRCGASCLSRRVNRRWPSASGWAVSSWPSRRSSPRCASVPTTPAATSAPAPPPSLPSPRRRTCRCSLPASCCWTATATPST